MTKQLPLFSLTKVCTKCGEEKPATEEFFRYDKRYSLNLFGWCRDCEKQYRIDNAERLKEYNEAYNRGKGHKPFKPKTKDGKRRCPTCGTWKPLDADHFHRSKNQTNGLTHICAECSRKKHRDYYNNNRAKRLRYQKKYYRNNRHKVLLCKRKWVKRNKETVNRQKRIWQLNRKAVENDLPNTLTQEQWDNCLNYFNTQCAVCGTNPDMFIRLDADHWIPLSHEDCPGTVAINMVPLCSSKQGVEGQIGCNQSKGNRDPKEWLVERFGKRKARHILKRIHSYFEWVKTQ